MANAWYSLVGKDSGLAQGDFIFQAHIPRATSYSAKDLYSPPAEGGISYYLGDWIVLTQSCDLIAENGKNLNRIVLCPVFTLSEFAKHNAAYSGDSENKKSKRATIINNKEVGLHALKKTGYARYPDEPFIVNLYDPVVVDLHAITKFAKEEAPGQRLRLRPPYAEALAQRFGLVFSRIGYPEVFPTKQEIKEARGD